MSNPLNDLSLIVAQINPCVGDITRNCADIKKAALSAPDADILIFPELCITGYPPEDLLLKPAFLADIHTAIDELCAFTKDIKPALLVSAPVQDKGALYNAALLIAGGEILETRYKHHLPNYGVFDEKRYFSSGPLPLPMTFKGHQLGVMTCEDLWQADVAKHLADQGAECLIALNASPFDIQKQEERFQIARQRAQETALPVLYVNQVGGQDDVIFDGASFALDADGKIKHMLPAFQTMITPLKDAPVDFSFAEEEALFNACVLGLRDYVQKNGFSDVLLGLSGGIDSALVAAIAAKALGAENVRGVMLPSRHTSAASFTDATKLAEALGIYLDEIEIQDIVQSFAKPLPKDAPGVMMENLQSRSRGVLLMALSNASGALLLSTGNKSEMACGYATLYGDMNGAYNPIKDLYKTQVYALCRWLNANAGQEIIPANIITKAPTAELRDNQTDQDSLPPYEDLDLMIKLLVEEEYTAGDIAQAHNFDLAEVQRVETMILRAEYKRRQAPPGPKLTRNAFGRERRYPITNGYKSHS